MSLEKLIKLTLANKALTRMANKHLVENWWPKPTIKPLAEKYWGDKWRNVNSGCMHKYECRSFSAIGFHSGEDNGGLPSLWCLGYGETPEQAYDAWCRVFNVWNKQEDWVK